MPRRSGLIKQKRNIKKAKPLTKINQRLQNCKIDSSSSRHLSILMTEAKAFLALLSLERINPCRNTFITNNTETHKLINLKTYAYESNK